MKSKKRNCSDKSFALVSVLMSIVFCLPPARYRLE